ncbi:MAG: hypothetical protein AAB535_01865 [Patescibacteria group bacterium]
MVIRNQKGQVLVIVLLSMSVVLTLVLYILSRSVTDIAVSSRGEEAIRAFSAAEAGIERALVIGSSPGTFENASFNAVVSGFSEGTNTFNYPFNLASGDSATLWFMNHDASGNLICDGSHACFSGNSLKVCWGKPGTAVSSPETPAIEASTFYNNGTLKIGRVAFDPKPARGNNFNSPDTTNGTCIIGDKSYQFGKTFGIPSLPDGGLKFARVKMFYNTTENHEIGFQVAGDTLPSQGSLISSTGSSGEANRKLEVFQSWSEAPMIFDNAVFSSVGLVK